MNCLKRAHIGKVGEVLQMSDEDLLKIRNFGEKSLRELRDKLVEQGITTPSGDTDANDFNGYSDVTDAPITDESDVEQDATTSQED